MATFPPRCFTCAKIITNTQLETFLSEVSKGKNQKNVLDDLKFSRRCCRRMFLSFKPSIEEKMLLYSLPDGNRAEIELPIVKSIKLTD